MPTHANRNSELRTQDSELLSCKGWESEVPSAIRLDSKAPPANSENEAPPAVKKLSPCPAQSNTFIIETRQTTNGKRQTAFQTGNRKPETVNQPLETSSSAPDPDRQALPFLVPKSVLEPNQPHPSDPYQEDCIVPLKNERYRRGGIY
jgi:hypothetical protein